MLATRPASPDGASRAQPEELSAAAPHEEKRIPGVKEDALKEERKPLLDLDDVEQLESELAACFDAPPPPPLNIDIQREEVTATASEWTPAAEPRYLDNRYVAPHAPSLSTVVRGDEQQQQQATRVSDYSSLYSPPTNLAVSSRETLYPALIPTAPSADVARTHSRGAGVQQSTAGQVVDRGGAAAAGGASGATATTEVDPAVAWGLRELGASMAAVEARERGGAAAGVAAAAVAAKAGEAPVQVVEELLSENERLRLIIQDMSEELDRVTFQLNEGAEAVVREVPAVANDAAAQSQSRAPASRTEESGASSGISTALVNRYPGAQAEAARRLREAGGQQSGQQNQQQQEEQGNQEQTLRRGIFVHFKCDNCPQWLKVPGHAQLVYCPTCSHTSQMTSTSTLHFPPNSRPAAGSDSAAGGGGATSAATDEGEGVGWFGYIKSVLAS